MSERWTDKKRGYVSNLFPPIVKNVSYAAAAVGETGKLDMSFGFFNGIRIQRFGLYEKVYQYKPDGSFVVPGDLNPEGTSGTADTSGVCPQGVRIGYTTLQMNINESQGLSIIGGGTGVYTWEVVIGGGSMSGSVYTAPSSNVNCLENPTITLSCNGVVMDSLRLSINAHGQGTWVYFVYKVETLWCGSEEFGGFTYCGMTRDFFDCTDRYLFSDGVMAGGVFGDTCEECYDYGAPGTTLSYFVAHPVADGRSNQDKLEGCCPAGLL